MIEQAEIRFKAAKDSFCFGKTNVISGENARGKTSVLTAIYYALTGRLPYGKISDFIPWGDKELSIVLKLDWGEIHVVAKKSAKKTVITPEGRFEGEAARAFLSEKYPPQVMEIGMSVQGQSDTFLQMTPANRLAYLKGIFDFGGKEVLSDLEERKQGLEKEITFLEGAIQTTKQIAERQPTEEVDPRQIEKLEKQRDLFYQNQKTRQKKQAVLKRIESKGRKLSSEIALYESGVCPTCRRPWDVDITPAKRRRERLREIYARVSKLEIPVVEDPTSLLSSLQMRLGAAKTQLNEIEEAKQKLQGLVKEKTDLIKKRDTVRAAISVVSKEYPKWALSLAINNLNHNIQSFIASCQADLDMRIEHTSKGVGFLYRKTTEWRDTALASGYERQVISLAFRKAVGDYVGCPVFFLDEADSFASDTNSGKLLSTFCGGKQTFLVTHKPEAAKQIYGAKIIEV